MVDGRYEETEEKSERPRKDKKVVSVVDDSPGDMKTKEDGSFEEEEIAVPREVVN